MNAPKTNAMRILERSKVDFIVHCYESTPTTSGEEVARILGQDPNRVFKTLVTISKSKKIYVFMLPVNRELDLKKAAEAVGEKALDMLKSKELLQTVGYIHGGCSPIGMKKNFPTCLDSSAQSGEKIVFSGGKIGWQVELNFADLKKALNYKLADITFDTAPTL